MGSPYVIELDERAKEELVARAAPTLGKLLLLFKVVMVALLMTRFYKLGQNIKELWVDRKQKKHRAANAAAPASVAAKAAEGKATAAAPASQKDTQKEKTLKGQRLKVA